MGRGSLGYFFWVEKGTFSLAFLGVIAFFCKYSPIAGQAVTGKSACSLPAEPARALYKGNSY
jgi:hypothetical protein